MSRIANGPIGAPVEIIQVLSMVCGSATPFTTIYCAEFKNGTNKEFNTYPGCSLYIGIGTIPISFANSIVRSKTNSYVPSYFIISAILNFQISFAICKCTYLSGFFTNCLFWLGIKVDEFDAKIISSLAFSDNSS